MIIFSKGAQGKTSTKIKESRLSKKNGIKNRKELKPHSPMNDVHDVHMNEFRVKLLDCIKNSAPKDIIKKPTLVLHGISNEIDYHFLCTYLTTCYQLPLNCKIILEKPIITLKARNFFTYLKENNINYVVNNPSANKKVQEFIVNPDEMSVYHALPRETRLDFKKIESEKPNPMGGSSNGNSSYYKRLSYSRKLISQDIITIFHRDNYFKNSQMLSPRDLVDLNTLHFHFQGECLSALKGILNQKLKGMQNAKELLLNSLIGLYTYGTVQNKTPLLIGPPGTGKTTLGVIGSQLISYNEIIGQLLTRLDLAGIAEYSSIFFHLLTPVEKKRYTGKIKKYNKILKSSGLPKIKDKEANETNFKFLFILNLYEKILSFAKKNFFKIHHFFYSIIPMSASSGQAEFLLGHKGVFVGADAGALFKSMCSLNLEEDRNILEELFQSFAEELRSFFDHPIFKSTILENQSHLQTGLFPFMTMLRTILLIIDELEKFRDKHGNSATNNLLSFVGTPDGFFFDSYMDSKIFIKGILIIATANGKEDISPPVLDRMIEVFISSMTLSAKIEHSRTIARELLKAQNLFDFVHIDPVVFSKFITECSKNTIGFRQIHRDIQDFINNIHLNPATRFFIYEKKNSIAGLKRKKPPQFKNITIRKFKNKQKIVVDEKFINTFNLDSNTYLKFFKGTAKNQKKKQAGTLIAKVRGGSYEQIALQVKIGERSCGAPSNVSCAGPFDFIGGSNEASFESKKNAVENLIRAVLSTIPKLQQNILNFYILFVTFTQHISESEINKFVYSVIIQMIEKYLNTPGEADIASICGVNTTGELILNNNLSEIEQIRHIISFLPHIKKIILPASLSTIQRTKIKSNLLNIAELKHLKLIYCNTINDAMKFVFPNIDMASESDTFQ